MNRKTLDRLLASGGLIAAIVLLIAGGLLGWAHNFVHNEVHSQLAEQQIFFPAKGSDALKPAEIGPYLNKYAGQQLVNGAQAKAYADHFIKVHLNESLGGQTYAQLSTKAMQNKDDQQLAGQVATAFKGETLRSMLLNAYAFDTMGYLAGIGAIVAYAGGALMAVLAGLGFLHARRIHSAAPPTTGETRELVDA